MQVTLKKSKLKGNYKNPSKDFMMIDVSWDMTFHVKNEDYDPSDEYDDEYNYVTMQATSYHRAFIKSFITKKEALESIKNTLRIVVQWYRKNRPATWQRPLNGIDIDYNSFDHSDVAEFIKLFDPERKTFDIDDLQDIHQYHYILYGTCKAIDYMVDNYHGDTIFNSDEEFLEWIDYV